MDQYLEKIEKQIENIENRIHTLMEDIEIEDLTPSERMDFAIKLMGQQVKFLHLRKSCELNRPEGREEALMAVWMKQLRGETTNGT